MNLFKENEEFQPGSPARAIAYRLAAVGEFLSELSPGWQYSPTKRAKLGLDPEFGAELARVYQDWS